MPGPAKRNGGIGRRDLLKAAGLAALPLGALVSRVRAATPHPRHLWGVNLAGADFGNLLGTHGTEYLYPPPENIAYYARLGFTLVRIPFKWERLQPDLNAPFAEAELTLLQDVVGHARRFGLTVVLDPHNYAKRRLRADGWKREYLIGSDEVPLAAYTAFWARLADQFKSDEKVIFGLMNEPTGLPAAKWLEIANAAIAAIRGQGTARNMVFVPGTDYTGAHSWFAAGNTVMERVKDPGENFAIEVHQYFDRDSSGTKPSAVFGTIGSERIEAFQTWARARGIRAFLGEYNGGRDALSSRALMDLCDELNANSDVWLGSAAWAGGPRWPEDDMFNMEPYKTGRIREQTAIIKSRFGPEAPKSFWAGAAPAVYADFARGLTNAGAEPRSLLRLSVSREAKVTSQSGLAAPSPLHGKGIPIGPASGPLLAHGELAELLSRPEFTILIETRGIDPASGGCSLLSIGDAQLLYCNANGDLMTGLSGGLEAKSAPAKRWASKRRCALSIRRATEEVTIGMTDAEPISGKGLPSILLRERPQDPLTVQIGFTATPNRNGFICRIVGFATFMGAAELAGNVA